MSNSRASDGRVKIKMANVNRVSGRTVNNPMVSVPVSNNRKTDNSPDSNAARGNSPASDSRMNRSRVSAQENDNQVSDSLDNNQTDNSPDSRKAISLSAGNNRGSRSQVNVSLDKLRANNLNQASNPDNVANRVNNLKRVSVSRDNHNLGNVASEVLRGCLTTTKRAGLSSLKGARTARLLRFLVKIF